MVDQRFEDAAHQAVSPLHALVRVGIGAHRDVVALPPLGGELATKDLGRVDLDHDLGLEVPAGVHVQVRVGRPSEAVAASMAATPIGVDRVVERHLRGGRDLVDDRLGLDLDALDPSELGRVEGSSRDLEELLAGHRLPA